jgi:hypothetical protein
MMASMELALLPGRVVVRSRVGRGRDGREAPMRWRSPATHDIIIARACVAPARTALSF